MNINDYNPKIILSSSLTTGRRFIKKQNLNGVALMNFDIYTPETLVKEKIIKLKPGYRLIGNDESAYLLLTLIRKNDYKLGSYVTSFGAASKLLEVIDDYRYNENNNFTHLIKADYQNLLKDYLSKLEEKRIIDYISALSLLLDNKQKEDCYVIDDLYLRPLEEKVFKSMFANFTKVEDQGKDYQISSVFKCYGQYNEVANLLDYIHHNKIMTGDVEVLYTDSVFENIIKGLCSSRNIPYTLKSNHAKTSNFVSFIYDILNYYKNDYKYELLENILSNQGLPSFYLKEFYNTLSYPKYVVGLTRKRSAEFIEMHKTCANSFPHFLKMFSEIISITENGLDYVELINLAKKYIEAKNEIDALSNQLFNLQTIIDLEEDTSNKIDLIISLLDRLTYNEGDSDDGISFSRINKSFTLRKHIFVLGCNQTSLIGSDVENAFIENVEEYQKELEKDLDIHTVNCQQNKLIDNTKYYLSHSDPSILLSYSCFDKVNLKDMTEGIRLVAPSCTLEHIYKNLYYAQDKHVQFINKLSIINQEEKTNFDNGVVNPVETDKAREIGQAEVKEIPAEVVEQKTFTLSPSDALVLIECPFHFYYSKIMSLPSASFPTLDETTWLENNTRGTMFHKVMECYFNEFKNKKITSFDEAIFEQAFEQALKEAESVNPVNNEYIYKKEAEDLKQSAKTYIKQIIETGTFDKYLVLGCEYVLRDLNYFYKKTIDGKEKTYFKFTGIVDRVDGYVEDKVLHLRIVDYKTGQPKARSSNKYVQHILYTYVLEKALGKNQFNLTYDSVVIDEFIYAFPLTKDDKKQEFTYIYDEMKAGSKDYNKVFNAIEGLLIPYLDGEKNILQKFSETFMSLHPVPKDGYNDGMGSICGFCDYRKECVKKLEWGDKVW